MKKCKKDQSEKQNVSKIRPTEKFLGEWRADGRGGDREGLKAVASHLVAGPTHRPQRE